MKYTLRLSVTFLVMSQIVFSQTPKKIIVEHFTNTNCSICASRNPGFYTNLNTQNNAIHLAIHPSSPYPACLLSQQNQPENDHRTNYYGVYGGTPRLVINGDVISTSVNYSLASIFAPYLSQTSPASIRIEQQKFGTDSIISSVIIKTTATHSLGSLALFVALAEDTVFYTGTNGETQHYDVFRKALTNVTGDSFTLPANVGDSVMLSFSSLTNINWNFNRIYTLAILQESATKALVQAETISANASTSMVSIKRNCTKDCKVYPNPANDLLNIELPDNLVSEIILTNAKGEIVMVQNGKISKTVLDISALTSGNYTLTIKNNNGSSSQKVIIK